jgi:hypothetical protein
MLWKLALLGLGAAAFLTHRRAARFSARVAADVDRLGSGAGACALRRLPPAWSPLDRTPERPCTLVHLRQRGALRLAPGEAWRPFEAEQWIATGEPAFLWYARLRGPGGLPLEVVDRYLGGVGEFEARIAGCVTVARGRGPEVDAGQLARYLGELPLAPPAWTRCEGLRVTPGAAGAAVLEAAVGSSRAELQCTFGETGEVREVRALRPRTEGQTTVPTPWLGRHGDYRTVGGLWVPTRSEAAWILPEGEFPYWRATLEALELR